jgi:hypothetical protein
MACPSGVSSKGVISLVEPKKYYKYERSYATSGVFQWNEVKGASVKNDYGLDLFSTKTKGGNYEVIEAKSGYRVGGGTGFKKLSDSINDAMDKISKNIKLANANISSSIKDNLSPRYKRGK